MTAATLLAALGDAGVDTAGVQSVPGRTTTRKTRFLAEGSFRFPQQVARVDRGTRAAVAPEIEAGVIAAIHACAGAKAAFLVSDYRYGTITPAVAAAVRASGVTCNAVTAVDSQGSLDPYHGYTLVRDNRADAADYLREPLDTVSSVVAALPRLRNRLDAANIVISLGDAGLVYLDAANSGGHIPADRVDVYDVTGAGDTLIVVLTLALAAGLSLEVAAHLANLAAGVAVRKLGNVVVTADELQRAILDADEAMFITDGQGAWHGHNCADGRPSGIWARAARAACADRLYQRAFRPPARRPCPIFASGACFRRSARRRRQ